MLPLSLPFKGLYLQVVGGKIRKTNATVNGDDWGKASLLLQRGLVFLN